MWHYYMLLIKFTINTIDNYESSYFYEALQKNYSGLNVSIIFVLLTLHEVTADLFQ
jgi:hypothetical protein